MTETPKCPYCGADTRLNENNEGIYWYECRECNATGPTENTPVEAFSAALHRAEPDASYQQLSKALCGKENVTLDDHINGSTGFAKGWKRGWNHGAELMLELVEKHGLDVVRKAHENLKAQEENPPE